MILLQTQHAPFYWHHIVTGVTSFFAGGYATRLLVTVSKSLPPLPTNATWKQTFGYNLLKNITDLDPSSKITAPWDGKTERRGNGDKA